MSAYETLLKRVTENPEDDSARLAFAAALRPSDPDRATFIEKQIELAVARRRARRYATPDSKDPLLSKHEQEWSRTIAKYTRSHQFDRGFVTNVVMDPFMFLEYGEWLYVNAPIRTVEFGSPDEGTFPISELAASPLLNHLDMISIWGPELSDEQLLEFARSPNLKRLLYFAVGSKIGSKRDIGADVFEAFATHAMTAKLLQFSTDALNFPGQVFGDTGRDDMQGRIVEDWLPMCDAGRALEQRHGYLPWLHSENDCEKFDAGYYVANRILPVHPVGSRV